MITKTQLLTLISGMLLAMSTSLCAQTFRIMTAGDSITATNRYQNHMRTLFSAGGYTTSWLGTQGSAPNKHEGWSGKGLDHFNWPTAGGSNSIRDYMNAEFGTSAPAAGTVHVVTLMLGINNMDHGLGMLGGGSTGFPDVDSNGWADGPKLNDNPGHDAWITGHVNQLVDRILSHPAEVKLVIAKIPPVGRGRDSLSANFAACISRINRLNTSYQAKFDSLPPALKARVRIVDLYAITERGYGNAPVHDFGTEAQQQGDWVHPRPDAGLWAETAQIFHDAILSFSAPTYAVSGTITLSGSGQSGVNVSAGSSNATTDSNGNFTLNLPNGSYTLSPNLAGFSYSPTSRSITVNSAAISGQNFNATALPTYSISGTITDGVNGISGVTVSDGTRSASTNSAGFYTLNNVPQGAFTLTPSIAGYTFSPLNRAGTLNGNLTEQNFTGTYNPATYDGFDYAAGTGALASKNGGTNWNSAWDSGSNHIVNPGLSYTSGGNLSSTGNKAVFANNTGSFRNVSASLQPAGTYWISFLARSTNPGSEWGGLSLFDGSNERLFIGQRFGQSNWGIERSGGVSANSAIGTGSVSFLVAKVVLKAGTDDVYFWVNPSLASTPTDASATQMLGVADFSFNRIRIQHGLGSGQTLEIDEVRIGQSYAEVAPIASGGGGGGSAPVINPGQSASGMQGSNFSYQIVASNSPTSFTLASGTLPSGITLNTSSGILSGTPSAAGTFTPSFTATNGNGTSSPQSVTISISSVMDPILTGSVSGSAPYGGFAIYDANKVFDGNTSTFFAPDAAVGGFAQIDLGVSSPGKVTTLRFMARSGYTQRMVSGRFEGSNNGTSWTALHTVGSDPGATWQQVTINDPTFYRYLRYIHPSGMADIAEVEFRGIVQPSGTALDTFRSAHGLPANGSGDTATPANDGVSNLLKYAFNMIGSGSGQATALNIPNNQILSPAGTAGLPLLSLDGTGKLQITFLRRTAASNSGITYTVEFSDDLNPATWAANPSATVAITNIDTNWERVVVTDQSGAANRFGRVKVSTSN